jgi:hypothetical protein
MSGEGRRRPRQPETCRPGSEATEAERGWLGPGGGSVQVQACVRCAHAGPAGAQVSRCLSTSAASADRHWTLGAQW